MDRPVDGSPHLARTGLARATPLRVDRAATFSYSPPLWPGSPASWSTGSGAAPGWRRTSASASQTSSALPAKRQNGVSVGKFRLRHNTDRGTHKETTVDTNADTGTSTGRCRDTHTDPEKAINSNSKYGLDRTILRFILLLLKTQFRFRVGPDPKSDPNPAQNQALESDSGLDLDSESVLRSKTIFIPQPRAKA